MQNILIVTDFSEASQNAGRYGVALAKQFGAKVTLFHAYQAPVQIPESYVFYTIEDVWESARDLLKKEVELVDPNRVVEMEVTGGEGVAANAIVAEAQRIRADLIVCGMKGMAKAFRQLFGSTTTALTKKSAIPILIIPQNCSFQEPLNIALACDIDPQTSIETVDMLREISEKFHSKLSIVWAVEAGVDAANEMRFCRSELVNKLKGKEIIFDFPSGKDIAKTLGDYIRSNGIDLMAIISHKHDFLERLFVESITKKMIFHTDIPLLVLPQKLVDNNKQERTPAKEENV